MCTVDHLLHLNLLGLRYRAQVTLEEVMRSLEQFEFLDVDDPLMLAQDELRLWFLDWEQQRLSTDALWLSGLVAIQNALEILDRVNGNWD